jgi:hypothetical protein
MKSMLLAIMLLCAVPALAATPGLINYQGVLTDAAGQPLNGSHAIIFSIYPGASSTPASWVESHPAVTVVDGVFNVILGGVTPIPDSLFDATERWLGVKVDQNAEISPRARLTSVPWALRAAVADSALTGPGGSDADWIAAGSNQYSGVSGNVGIGTSAPATKLHLEGGNAEAGIRVGWGAAYPYLYGEIRRTTGNGLIINSNAAGGWADINFQADGVTRAYLTNTGSFGIGTSVPARKLHIDGANVADGLRIAWGSDYPTVYGEITHGLGSGLVINSAAGGGSWADITFQTNGTTRATLTSAGYLGIGTAAPTALLEVAGTAKVGVLEIIGADLAEKFPISDEVKPGMVVSIDPNHPGQLCLTREAYDHRVAGVVSGANGLSVGAVLGNLPGSENSVPIALSGRVWVWCDATGGAIEPGDRLTTSTRPGYAMKTADDESGRGAVLGKAMTRLEAGSTGLVLTLVNLQ